jgi:MoaA/NifB/PqqE/SkfB family radical SAM enzyme
MGIFIGQEMSNDKVTLGWDLCYTCNYRCPYCGVWEKCSEKNLYLTTQEWVAIWHRLYGLYGCIHIYMSGGEPSTYPEFFELVEALSKEHSIEICTNLSWDVERLVSQLGPGSLKIAPTFHPTFAEFTPFLKKVIRIKQYLPDSQVYYVAHPGQIAQMRERSRMLKEEGVNLIPLPLRGDGFVLNSEEEKRIVEEISPYRGEKIGYQLKRISPRGRLCRAGQRYAVIRADGTVDRCSQHSGGMLGSILDEDFRLYSGPLACERDYCPIESQWIVENE